MTDNIVLRTKQATFETLHAAIEGRRSGAMVDRDVLMDLLLDHSNMVGQLERVGFRVVDKEQQHTLPARVRKRTR